MTYRISTAMAGAMVCNKTLLAGSGAVGLCTGSTGIAYLTKAQIQFNLISLGIRNLAP
ncbi:MAG: hypothetical protein ACREX9_05070 [Gammaproteobacteria bacterium]